MPGFRVGFTGGLGSSLPATRLLPKGSFTVARTLQGLCRKSVVFGSRGQDLARPGYRRPGP